VLVDQMMPGISGDEIVGRLRSDHPDLPVVIVSSLDSAEAAVG
jgi:CheY-like chemotaxis protein